MGRAELSYNKWEVTMRTWGQHSTRRHRLARISVPEKEWQGAKTGQRPTCTDALGRYCPAILRGDGCGHGKVTTDLMLSTRRSKP